MAFLHPHFTPLGELSREIPFLPSSLSSWQKDWVAASSLPNNPSSSKAYPFTIPLLSHTKNLLMIMIFRHPSIQEACQLKALISDFSEASGANINKVKSQIFFFNTFVITHVPLSIFLVSPLRLFLLNI